MAAQHRLVTLLEHYRNRLHGLGNAEHDEELEYIHQILSSPLFRQYKVGGASHEDTNKIIEEATKEMLSGIDAPEEHQLSPGEKKRRQVQRKQSLRALRNAVTPGNSPMVQSKGSSGRKLSAVQTPPSEAQQIMQRGGVEPSQPGVEQPSYDTPLASTSNLKLSSGSLSRPEHSSVISSKEDGHSLHSASQMPYPPQMSPSSYPHPLQMSPSLHPHPPSYPHPPQMSPSLHPHPPSYPHPPQMPSKRATELPAMGSIVSASSPLPPSSPHYVAPPATEAMASKNTPTVDTRRVVFPIHLEKGEEGLGFRVKGVRLEQKGDVGGIFIQDLQPGGIAERNGQLRRNDQLISINGHPLEGIPHAEAVKLLQAARGLVELVVSRELSSYESSYPQTHPQSGVHSKISQLQKIETIELPNERHGFGFGVIQSKDVGTVIHSILPGGVADRDGRLRQNDRLLQINETAVRHVPYEAVVTMLREASQGGKMVRLVVGHILQEQEDTKAMEMPVVQPSDDEMEKFEVELRKPLGMTIAGLVHPDTGDEVDGIYITSLNPSGAAAQHGGILKGDRILEVDGQTLSGMENMEAAAVLRNSGNLVKLVLARKKKLSSHESQHCVASNEREFPQVAENKPLVDEMVPPPVGGDEVGPPPVGGDEVVSPPVGDDELVPQPVGDDEVVPPPVGSNEVVSPPVGSNEVVPPPVGSDEVVAVSVDNNLPKVNKEQMTSAGDGLLLSPPVPYSQPQPSGEGSAGLVQRLPPTNVSQQTTVPLDMLQNMSRTSPLNVGGSECGHAGNISVMVDREGEGDNDEKLLQKWSKHVGPHQVVEVVRLSRDSREQSLGILMESTAQLDDGGIGRVHHVIQHIRKDGLIGKQGLLQEGDEILEVNGTAMLGLEHSKAADVLKDIMNQAVIVVCHPFKDEFAATGSVTTLKDVTIDSEHSESGDHGGTGDEGGSGDALDSQRSPINTSSESIPQLFELVAQDDFSRRFARQSWRERHEVERRRLKQQFEKRREEYERHIREQEEELLQQERELHEHQLQQAQEEERHQFGIEKRSSALLQETDFDYSSYHSPYMMHQSPDSGGTESSTMLSPVPGSGMWESEVTVIDLEKGPHGLGFSLLDFADPFHTGAKVIVVHSLVPGGVAEMDGRLQVGDRLVSVNGVSVTGQSVQFAVQQLTGVKLGVVKIGVNHSLPTSPDFNSSPISLDSSHPFFAAEGQSIIDIRSQEDKDELQEGTATTSALQLLKQPVNQVSAQRERAGEGEGTPGHPMDSKTVGEEEEEMREEKFNESDGGDEGAYPLPPNPQQDKPNTELKVSVDTGTKRQGLVEQMQQCSVANSQVVHLSTGREVQAVAGPSPQLASHGSLSQEAMSSGRHQHSSQDSFLTRLSPDTSELSADNEPELREAVVPKGSGANLGITLSYDDKNCCVIVKSVSNNSPIGKDGRIRIGDRIVSINRKSLEGASLTKAKSILRRATAKDEDVRITYLPCVPVMAAVVPSGRTLVKASSAGTLDSPHLHREQPYSYMDGMGDQHQVLQPLPLASSLQPQSMLPHSSPLSQLSTPWQQHPFYAGLGSQPPFIHQPAAPAIRPPPPYTFPSRGAAPPPHPTPPPLYAWNMGDVPHIQMALPTQTIPMQWGPGIMHRDPPQYPEFMAQNGSGPQSAQYHHPMPRMSKSQSDSRFRSEQAKIPVERRHNSQGTNSGRTLPVYTGVHQTLDDQQAGSLPNNQPNNQAQDQHTWSHDSRGVENYWSQENPTGGIGWSHDQSVGTIGWSHDQSVGTAGWSQNQMVTRSHDKMMRGGDYTGSHDKMMGGGDYTGSKPAWTSLQDSPDHSHHNSLAMDDEEDTSLRKRYPDMEGHLYAVTLKKGKTGLGLSIVANNQAPRGIVIMGVQQGGVADSSGKIKWGDVILEVNDVSVIGKSQQKFQEMLAQAPVSVNLVLVRPPATATKHSGNISLEGLAQVRPVTLKREDERGFGLDISEVQGIDGEKSTLVISKIIVGSPADRCGQLQTGDQLISIDGQKVLGYSCVKAKCLLQKARSHGSVSLIVASNSPGGYPIELGGVVQRHGEAPGGVVQRHGEAPGGVVQRHGEGVVQRHGEAPGGVVQRHGEAPGGVVQRHGEAPGGVVQRHGEAPGGVVQRHGEAPGGVVQRHGEAQGGVVQRPSNAILRNRSRYNPLRQSRRRPISVDTEKDSDDRVTTIVQDNSTDHSTYTNVHVEGHSQLEKKDVTQGETSAIIIFKGSDPLGVNIVGGADTSLQGVYVQRIVPDSPAAKDDRLRAGDRILAIGSLTLENMTKEEVVQAIQQAGSFVHLTILRQTTGAMETVELVKPDGGGLGLLISELKDLPGIYVQEVVKNHAAHTNGHIRVGDRILSINGQDTTNADQGSVVKLLQACKGVISVTVQHSETAGTQQQSTAANDKLYQDSGPEESTGTTSGFPRPSYPSPSVRVPSHDPPPYPSAVHPRYTASHHQAGLETRSPYNTDKVSASPLEQGDNGVKKRVIKLRRGPSGLGFTIVGGKGSPQGDLPIYINRVYDKGAAARDGRVKAGNQLLAVNGVNFANVTHQYAADTLKYLQGDVELTVLSSD